MTEEINNLIPGQVLTPEQKEKLGKENWEASAEAQRLAAEHRTRDIQEGRGEPAVNAVADLIKKQLEREDFQKKE